MIDILINCALRKSHSIEFFSKKRLQSLQLPDSKQNKLFNRAVNYFSTDFEVTNDSVSINCANLMMFPMVRSWSNCSTFD